MFKACTQSPCQWNETKTIKEEDKYRITQVVDKLPFGDLNSIKRKVPANEVGTYRGYWNPISSDVLKHFHLDWILPHFLTTENNEATSNKRRKTTFFQNNFALLDHLKDSGASLLYKDEFKD